MYAERLILETDMSGNLKVMPTLPANKQFEVIFLLLEKPDSTVQVKRIPHPDIVGRVQILGDIMGSTPETDWDLLA
ncbi:MAG: hypothetical protein A2286_00715 [Gammaproteobacteria bacterium RIFOXYA12_FULL_61_12]|nr:MAG: hypothetical protein A2514_08830 [Gammaproteobacteria bacterium RIFOXYD12_FULL_61_37]OGT94135.1 MAG: hypothetical protein A2286_00715 [Gammaproteobacteria bacterium RIFOXYA12_FULL_61_12]